MVTDSDHIQNMRAKLHNKALQLENELAEIKEMMRVLERVPAKIGKGTIEEPATRDVLPRTQQNKNVTELVRRYIDDFGKTDTALSVPLIVKDLMEKHGVKGKYRSLYSATCVILKKETERKGDQGPRLVYEKGVGFYKPQRFGQKLGQAQPTS